MATAIFGGLTPYVAQLLVERTGWTMAPGAMIALVQFLCVLPIFLTMKETGPERCSATAFLFDLDGTLVDSVYKHVRAWHLALRDEGIELSIWRIHRKIGMSGGLFTNQLLRELGGRSTTERIGPAAHPPCGPLSVALE